MQKTRLWLLFPPRLITRAVLWELPKGFATAWLEEMGPQAEPLESGTFAS